MSFRFVALLIVATVAFGSIRAGAIQMVISGPGSQLFPIAISQLKNLGGDESHQASADFTNTLSRNLELSGFFRIVKPEANIEDPQNSGYQLGNFNFADWSSINAEFLVKGAATIKGNDATIEAFLYDVPRQQQLTGKRYTGQLSELPRMARRFADELMLATTGTRGPFDSPIACTSTVPPSSGMPCGRPCVAITSTTPNAGPILITNWASSPAALPCLSWANRFCASSITHTIGHSFSARLAAI